MNTDYLDIFLDILGGLIIVGLVVGKFFYGDSAEYEAPTKHQTVANEVANKVTDEVTNIVTETEVYKVVCTSDGEGYCKEYSVRRITKE